MITKSDGYLSASKIKAYLTCPYAYFLDTQIRESNLPITGFAAKSHWLKNAFRKLFPEERHVGPYRADVEDLRGEELARYLEFHSAKAFANATARWWRRLVIDKHGRVQGRDVAWSFYNQWFRAYHQIRTACTNFYNFLLVEGPPVLTFTDKEVTFDREVAFLHQGKKYITHINAIRKGLVVAEYGTESRTQKSLDRDWKITLKLLAFCTLAHEEGANRMKWGVEDGLAEKWGGAETYIGSEVTFRYYNLLHSTEQETKRTDADIPAMLEIIEKVEQRIARKEFPAAPSHQNCEPCSHNVFDATGTPVCSKKYSEVDTATSMETLIQIQAAQGREAHQLELF